MPTLTIRKLPEGVVERIKRCAEANGVSMEEEVRRFLVQRYMTRETFLERSRERAARTKGRITAEQAERMFDEMRRGRP